MLKIQFGLLDALVIVTLVTNKVLIPKQVSLIQDKETPTGRVRQLLKEITKKLISDVKKILFVCCLTAQHLKHNRKKCPM